jgi:hypothetical protein
MSRKSALEALTKQLMETESVDADELRRIIEESSPGPMVVPGTDAAAREKTSPRSRTMASGLRVNRLEIHSGDRHSFKPSGSEPRGRRAK